MHINEALNVFGLVWEGDDECNDNDECNDDGDDDWNDEDASYNLNTPLLVLAQTHTVPRNIKHQVSLHYKEVSHAWY